MVSAWIRRPYYFVAVGVIAGLVGAGVVLAATQPPDQPEIIRITQQSTLTVPVSIEVLDGLLINDSETEPQIRVSMVLTDEQTAVETILVAHNLVMDPAEPELGLAAQVGIPSMPPFQEPTIVALPVGQAYSVRLDAHKIFGEGFDPMLKATSVSERFTAEDNTRVRFDQVEWQILP